MRVLASQVSMAAASSRFRSVREEVSVRVSITRPQVQPAPEPPRPAVKVEDGGKVEHRHAPGGRAGESPRETEGAEGTNARERMNILLMRRLWNAHVKRSLEGTRPPEGPAVPTPPSRAEVRTESPPETIWRVEVSREREETTVEQVDFQSRGQVVTADGRAISWDLTQRMVDARTVKSSDQAVATNQKDPLALARVGGSVKLSSERGAIDLDGDGQVESIPALADGAGWLVRDTNGNGAVDGGAELFGPRSGDGFQELAALDQDHNGFVDEGDAAFTQLRLWQPGGEGGTLTTLKDAGVGALAVRSVNTPMTLRDASGTEQGTLRKTGVYLTEEGEAGLVQHVDVRTA